MGRPAIASRTPKDKRLDPQQIGGHRLHSPSDPVEPGGRRTRSPLKALVPLLVFAAIGLLIAREEVPAVADLWDRTFAPGDWQSRHTCREAALEELQTGQYARLVDTGEVHETQDGPYVGGMAFDILGEDGREQTIRYACYLDTSGQVFRLTRQSP